MWPEGTKTLELLDQAREGAAAAQEELLDRHREALRRMIALRLDPAIVQRVDASDIVQEVLLEASRRLDDYLARPVMPFHLWLRHLAKDHLIDAHRRHHLARKRGVDREQPLVRPGWAEQSSLDLAGHLLDQEPTPASAALRQELQDRMTRALARMGDDDREIILMRYFEQLGNQEIAEALGLTEAAASMRHLRAIRRLRDLLSPTQGANPEE